MQVMLNSLILFLPTCIFTEILSIVNNYFSYTNSWILHRCISVHALLYISPIFVKVDINFNFMYIIHISVFFVFCKIFLLSLFVLLLHYYYYSKKHALIYPILFCFWFHKILHIATQTTCDRYLNEKGGIVGHISFR